MMFGPLIIRDGRKVTLKTKELFWLGQLFLTNSKLLSLRRQSLQLDDIPVISVPCDVDRSQEGSELQREPMRVMS
jgi:hypothetical protein